MAEGRSGTVAREPRWTIGPPVIRERISYLRISPAGQDLYIPDDLPASRKKMREIIARNAPFTKEVGRASRPKKVFSEKGEAYKIELIDANPEETRTPQDLPPGRLVRSLPACPHPMPANPARSRMAFTNA